MKWQFWRRAKPSAGDDGNVLVPVHEKRAIDRQESEREKKEFEDELHEARSRLHYLEWSADVKARRTGSPQ